MRLVCWCMVHGLCSSFPLPRAFILVEPEQAANLESLHQGIGLSMPVFTDFPGPPETRAEDMPYVRLDGDQFTLHGSHSTISLVNLSYAHICFSSTDISLISPARKKLQRLRSWITGIPLVLLPKTYGSDSRPSQVKNSTSHSRTIKSFDVIHRGRKDSMLSPLLWVLNTPAFIPLSLILGNADNRQIGIPVGRLKSKC